MIENKDKQKGTTPEQRQWIKKRDNFQCQFHDFVFNDNSGKYEFLQCPRKVNPSDKGGGRWRLEVHHIFPCHMQERTPTRYGGENPFNLITLCAGARGEIGHHDLMAPFMILAKTTYKYDRWSYEKWIRFAHDALDKGLSTYDPSWDGMLKSIARLKTDQYLKGGASPFPYKRGEGYERTGALSVR